MIDQLLHEKEEYKLLPCLQTVMEKDGCSFADEYPYALPISREFLEIQDEYLKEETAKKGITRLEDLRPVLPGIYLWQGDITTLAADAIVNAANSQMLGCFVPCHGCIDNAIHSAAGIQLPP